MTADRSDPLTKEKKDRPRGRVLQPTNGRVSFSFKMAASEIAIAGEALRHVREIVTCGK